MYVIISSLQNALKLEHFLPEGFKDTVSYKSQKAVDDYVASRALLVKALLDFYNINYLPKIAFHSSSKPCFKEARYPFFNISNSSNYIVLALGSSELGIDIEFERERRNLDSLIKRVCSLKEQEYLTSLNKGEILHEFTRLWTVKECLVKTTGKGLADIDMLNVDPFLNTTGYYNLPSENLIYSTHLDIPVTDKLAYLSFSFNKKTEDDVQIFCLDENEKLQKEKSITIEKIYKNFSIKDQL